MLPSFGIVNASILTFSQYPQIERKRHSLLFLLDIIIYAEREIACVHRWNCTAFSRCCYETEMMRFGVPAPAKSDVRELTYEE